MMANFSDLTRKDQVLARLRESGGWVDGPDLATEAVGGSEGLRRLRELRTSGDYDIRERRHPDPHRDIWQYLLVERITPRGIQILFNHNDPPLPVPIDLSEAFDDARPNYPDHAKEAARREQAPPAPADPEPAPSPWPADHDQTPITSAVRRKEDGTYEYVPPQRPLHEQLTTPPDPPQPAEERFTSMPRRFAWGSVAICPRCHSQTTRGRSSKKDSDEGSHIAQRKAKAKTEGSQLVDPDGILLFRDPSSRKAVPCRRCGGYGIVPNKGPIPSLGE